MICRAARSLILVLGVVTYSALAEEHPLPYRAPDQHMGVASCASSVCHGSVNPSGHSDVSLNEFVTWSHKDAHGKAFDALLSPLGKSIALKLGAEPAHEKKICLDCHADNVPPAQRGPRFALSDGVGCEACHGGSQRWIASHSVAHTSHDANVHRGMFPLPDLGERARLCGSCHIGNADKWASHRIMGAGHPRLSFELDTFLALEPPHYDLDADYRHRKPTFGRARTWAEGQLTASAQQLALLQGVMRENHGVFPEFALFNCVSCHGASMHRPDLHRHVMNKAIPPGAVSLNDAHWRMSWLIARVIAPEEGAKLLAAGRELQRATLESQQNMLTRAQILATTIARVREKLQREVWDDALVGKLSDSVLDAALDGEFNEYLGAEQAVMALELMTLDRGKGPGVRPQLDELYRQVKEDEEFHPVQFLYAAQALRDQLASKSVR